MQTERTPILPKTSRTSSPSRTRKAISIEPVQEPVSDLAQEKSPSTSSTVLEGVLKIRTGRYWQTWNKYYIILKKTTLIYKKKKTDKKIAGFINLSKTSIWKGEEECGKKNSIMIYHPQRRTVFLAASNTHLMETWIKAMEWVRDYLGQFEEHEEYTSSSSDEEKEVHCCGISFNIKLPHPLKGNNSYKRAIDADVIEEVSMNKKKPLVFPPPFAIDPNAQTPVVVRSVPKYRDAEAQTEALVATTGAGQNAKPSLTVRTLSTGSLHKHRMGVKCSYNYCEQCPQRTTCTSQSKHEEKQITVKGQIDVNMTISPATLQRMKRSSSIASAVSPLDVNLVEENKSSKKIMLSAEATDVNIEDLAVSVDNNAVVDESASLVTIHSKELNDEEMVKEHLSALCKMFSQQLNINLNLSSISYQQAPPTPTSREADENPVQLK